ncbi:hypothetical protein [Pseudoteredinibacter isoporae]|uniref:hypothetical protein n=1 Tax=Pseudoteredinibacter isoporae TaxID=570281 RepID=UPI003340478C
MSISVPTNSTPALNAAIAQLEPVSGVHVEIELELNSHTFVFMVEKWNQDRRFASNRFQIQCVSNTQKLAAPYFAQRSKIFGAINAKQAAEGELQNTGFSLNWDTNVLPDWPIPAGAFSYQYQTPIEVISRIAEAVGAVIVPSKNANQITIQPRLKVSPWALAPNDAADVIIPHELIQSIGMDLQQGQVADTILVSGVSHGVIASVTRDGQPGNKPAPDVVDELITDQAAALVRARQEIGQSGKHALYDLSLPVPESAQAPGLILPGQVVEVQVNGQTDWKGYCIGTAINAPSSGNVALTQTPKVVRLYDH